ncbi:hypothetical protein PAXRUDRAFT_161265, partial [Paxillus rubicundulus Ve08.2h10]
NGKWQTVNTQQRREMAKGKQQTAMAIGRRQMVNWEWCMANGKKGFNCGALGLV